MSTPEAGPPPNFIRTAIQEDMESGRWGGRVVTRFPPEPNGYLHIGHAKAISIDFGLAEEFAGTCHLRFDDTNPAKEEVEYVESIQEDIRWLGYDWGRHLYFASDYFEQLYQWAEELIRRGLAYVDDLSAEEIRQYRGTLTEPGRNSPYRDRPVEENLDLFRRMRAGEFPDGARVLRAKIDMASPNMNMRDPTLYRIRHVAHHRTGDALVHLPDVRLRASPVGLDRAGHALPLHRSSTRTTARSTTGSARRSGSTTRSRSSSRASTSATPS